MVQVCVSRNLSITDNVLGIQPWSIPRHVIDQTFNSVGDGPFDQQTTLPGKLMIDSGILSWTNTSPLAANMLLRIQRARREYFTSNPNVVQIRDRFTTSITDKDPRVPDPSDTYQGATGGGVDVGATSAGQPISLQVAVWEDPSVTEDWIGPVPPGGTFKLWYRCYLWTPPPWSNNANANKPLHYASVFNARIQAMAFPTQDEDVVVG